MAKDAAIFTEGKISGRIDYPPWEDYDQETLRELQSFNVYPLGKITNFHRHIPYNSEKKAFLEKTGRDAFEGNNTVSSTASKSDREQVFQYTFQLPNNDKEYNVMWDYNIGLVRVTPFFKCCNYGKVRSIQRKALEEANA